MISNVAIRLVAFLCLANAAQAREWTNQEGRKIQADFVSTDGTKVVLKQGAREFSYSLDQLSEADREFVRSQAAAAPDTATQSVVTGWRNDFPIRPTHPDPKGYFESRNFKKVYDAFNEGNFPAIWDRNKKGNAAVEFALEEGLVAEIYVPSSYDGSTAYGIYCHVSPGDKGTRQAGYADVMDRLKLIYVSPGGTSNQRPMLRRIRLALDATTSVQKEFKIDPKRIVVGGLSGGGHMAMCTHASFPDVFMGAVSHAAQSYLPIETVGHFPGLDLGDLKGGALKGHKWCVISGDKDQNYQEIIKTSAEWDKNRFDYRFFDVPGMAHVNAGPAALEEALKWLGL